MKSFPSIEEKLLHGIKTVRVNHELLLFYFFRVSLKIAWHQIFANSATSLTTWTRTWTFFTIRRCWCTAPGAYGVNEGPHISVLKWVLMKISSTRCTRVSSHSPLITGVWLCRTYVKKCTSWRVAFTSIWSSFLMVSTEGNFLSLMSDIQSHSTVTSSQVM